MKGLCVPPNVYMECTRGTFPHDLTLWLGQVCRSGLAGLALVEYGRPHQCPFFPELTCPRTGASPMCPLSEPQQHPVCQWSK